MNHTLRLLVDMQLGCASIMVAVAGLAQGLHGTVGQRNLDGKFNACVFVWEQWLSCLKTG